MLKDIEQFRKRHKMSPATFGKLAVKDSSFVYRVRNGSLITMEKERQIRTFMETYDSLSD